MLKIQKMRTKKTKKTT